MRYAAVLLFLLILPGLTLAQQSGAQQASEKPATVPEVKKEAGEARPPSHPPAPKPGHPLDPADVDTLTGRNKPGRGTAGYGILVDPYGPYGYGRQSVFTTPGGPGSRFSTPGRGHRAGVSPLAIGRTDGETFVVLGGQAGRVPFAATLRGGRVSSFVTFFRSGFLFF